MGSNKTSQQAWIASSKLSHFTTRRGAGDLAVDSDKYNKALPFFKY